LPAHLRGVPAKKTASVPALERGLAILETLATHRRGLTLSQLVRHLHLPKSSIHSLLLTFEKLGYPTRIEPGGRYICGLQFLQIATLAFDNPLLRQTATPVLAEVMQATGPTVHLAATYEGMHHQHGVG
jgi:DNA-binding IclR family transcriptional regulator